MARIRTIKPDFPQSESMGRVSREARLCFILLWTVADDSGRARGSSRLLASLLYPFDTDAPTLIDGWLAELEREGCLVRYIVEGTTYVQIIKWLIHQKIDHPSPSRIPEFRDDSRKLANHSRGLDADLGSRILDLGPRTLDLGPTTAHSRQAKSTDPPDWLADFKRAYPKRGGDQGWPKALRAARSRIAEGHTPAELIAGAERYAAYVRAAGNEGTEFVKQAATFLGPDKPFLLPWNLPARRETDTERLMRLNGGSPATHEVFEHDAPAQLVAIR